MAERLEKNPDEQTVHLLVERIDIKKKTVLSITSTLETVFGKNGYGERKIVSLRFCFGICTGRGGSKKRLPLAGGRVALFGFPFVKQRNYLYARVGCPVQKGIDGTSGSLCIFFDVCKLIFYVGKAFIH